MRLTMRPILFLLWLIPTQLSATSNSDTVSQILEHYRLDCAIAQEGEAGGEPLAKIVPLKIKNESIYEIEITATGKTATVIVSDFICPGFGSYWCGSFGCSIHLIVDGVSYSTFGGQPFSISKGKEYFVITPRSGLTCDRHGAAPCYAVSVWDERENQFNIIGGMTKPMFQTSP